MTERKEVIRKIAGRIDSIRLDHPTRVGIDGVDAAGKTIFADELGATLLRSGRTVIRASIDGFHNPSAVRHQRGDSPEGYFQDSFDYSDLRSVLLDPLGPGGSRSFRRVVFDFRTDTPVEAPIEEAARDSILLFDGVFLLRPEVRDCWDFSIFVHASFSTTVKRAISRDVELLGSEKEVVRRYTERYVPGQKIYLSEVDPERLASVVVVNEDPMAPAIHPHERDQL